jgi:hypothetical protein
MLASVVQRNNPRNAPAMIEHRPATIRQLICHNVCPPTPETRRMAAIRCAGNRIVGIAVSAANWGRFAPRNGTCVTMTKEEEQELRAQLGRLLQEHRDLDAAIDALQDTPGSDLLQVQRLKKRKLYLKDRITFIEDQLTPDIIA